MSAFCRKFTTMANNRTTIARTTKQEQPDKNDALKKKSPIHVTVYASELLGGSIARLAV